MDSSGARVQLNTHMTYDNMTNAMMNAMMADYLNKYSITQTPSLR